VHSSHLGLTHRVSLEDFGHVCCVLNELLSNDVPWRSGRYHQVWALQMAEVSALKFSPDRKPSVKGSFEGLGCISFNFVFPFSSLLVGMVAINKQVAGNFASAKMEN